MHNRILALGLAALTCGAAAAPVKAGKLGFVDVQAVVQGLPAGGSFVALGKKADADLAAQAKAIQALQAKVAAKPSAADQQALTKALSTYQAAAKNYDAQRQKAFAPLAGKVNSAVATAAKTQGVTVVFDKRKAASGLVVYAAPGTDLTAAVQKSIK